MVRPSLKLICICVDIPQYISTFISTHQMFARILIVEWEKCLSLHFHPHLHYLRDKIRLLLRKFKNSTIERIYRCDGVLKGNYDCVYVR